MNGLERILAGQVVAGDLIAEDDPSMDLADYEAAQMEWLRVEAVERRYADLVTLVARDEWFAADSAMAGYPEVIGTRRFTGSPDQTVIRETR